jgi:hypothetical protein
MTPEQLEESLRRVREGRNPRYPPFVKAAHATVDRIEGRHASTLSRLVRTLVEIAVDPKLTSPAEREAEIEAILRSEEKAQS